MLILGKDKICYVWQNKAKIENPFFSLILLIAKKGNSSPKQEKKDEVKKNKISRYALVSFYPNFDQNLRVAPIFKTPYLKNGKRFLSSVKRFYLPY